MYIWALKANPMVWRSSGTCHSIAAPITRSRFHYNIDYFSA